MMSALPPKADMCRAPAHHGYLVTGSPARGTRDHRPDQTVENKEAAPNGIRHDLRCLPQETPMSADAAGLYQRPPLQNRVWCFPAASQIQNWEAPFAKDPLFYWSG